MIYVHMNGEQHGPFTVDELSELWKLGEIAPSASYWYRGMKSWEPVTGFKPPDPVAQRTPAERIRLSTADTIANAEIETELDIITAECVLGLAFLHDIFAAVRDVVGGRSKAMQDALRTARKTCLDELRNEAHALRADAVIAIDLDYSEISGQGKSMLFLVASGTAVRLVADPPPWPE